MARRGKPQGFVPWYLNEWMDACDLRGRGAQARLMELTGWSKATASQLCSGKQDFSPKILAEAAQALNIEPFELLITPERANAFRRFRASAEEMVSIAHSAEPEPLKSVEDNGNRIRRAANQ